MDGIHRGLVIEKIRAHDVTNGTTVYVLKLQCEDDGCCEDALVVTREMHDSVCIAGLGHDTTIEYGRVLRIVPTEKLTHKDNVTREK